MVPDHSTRGAKEFFYGRLPGGIQVRQQSDLALIMTRHCLACTPKPKGKAAGGQGCCWPAADTKLTQENSSRASVAMGNVLLGQGAQGNQAILPEMQTQPYTSLTHYTLTKKATWGKLWMLWEFNAEHSLPWEEHPLLVFYEGLQFHSVSSGLFCKQTEKLFVFLTNKL